MNQVAKIEKSSGQVFCLTHSTLGEQLHKIEPPAPDTKWQTLPERFFDGITFASHFTGSAKGYSSDREYVERVHCSDGKAFATDNQSLVEYDIGATPAFALESKRVAMLKSFGDAPTRISVEEGGNPRLEANTQGGVPSQQFAA